MSKSLVAEKVEPSKAERNKGPVTLKNITGQTADELSSHRKNLQKEAARAKIDKFGRPIHQVEDENFRLYGQAKQGQLLKVQSRGQSTGNQADPGQIAEGVNAGLVKKKRRRGRKARDKSLVQQVEQAELVLAEGPDEIVDENIAQATTGMAVSVEELSNYQRELERAGADGAELFVGELGQEQTQSQTETDLEEIKKQLTEIARSQAYNPELSDEEALRFRDKFLEEYCSQLSPEELALVTKFFGMQLRHFRQTRKQEVGERFSKIDQQINTLVQTPQKSNSRNDLSQIKQSYGHGLTNTEWQGVERRYYQARRSVEPATYRDPLQRTIDREAEKKKSTIRSFFGRLKEKITSHWLGKALYVGGKVTLGLLKNISDATGLTALVTGVAGVVAAPFKVTYGLLKSQFLLSRDLSLALIGKQSFGQAFKNYGSNLKAATAGLAKGLRAVGRALKGAVLVAGELTGITDLVHCVHSLGQAVKYALQGNWAMAGLALGTAAMHAAFFAISFSACAATLVTLGTGGFAVAGALAAKQGLKAALKVGATAGKSAGKKVLKRFAKRGLEGLAGKLSKTVMSKISKGLKPALVQEFAAEAAQEVMEGLNKQVVKNGAGALTKEAVQQTSKEVVSEMTEQFLRDKGVLKIIDKLTYKLLRKTGNVKKLAKELVACGYDKRTAKKMAKQIKKAFRFGRSDEHIKEILAKPLREQLSDYLVKNMEGAYKANLKALLKESVDSPDAGPFVKALREKAEAMAKKASRQVDEVYDDLVQETVEASWKGAREGVEEAVEKIVREGIESAFKRFRRFRMQPRFRGQQAGRRGGVLFTRSGVLDRDTEALAAKEDQQTEVRKQDVDVVSGTRVEFQEVNGNMYRVFYERDDDGREHQAGMQLVGEVKKKKKKTAA